MSKIPNRGYPVSFVDQLPKEIQIECPICLNVLFDPVLVTCCDHSFCSVCISAIDKAREPCPLCGHKKFTFVLDKRLERILNGLKVYCPNRDKGCDWIGDLGQCNDHLRIRIRSGKHRSELYGLYIESMCPYEINKNVPELNKLQLLHKQELQSQSWKKQKHLIKLRHDIECGEKLLRWTILVAVGIVLALFTSWAMTALRNEHLCKEMRDTIKTKVVEQMDRSTFTESQCAVRDTPYDDFHARTMPTCDLVPGFGLEVYKPPDAIMSSQSHAYTQLVENDTCAAEGADSCTCICTCIENDVHTDSTKDPKPGTMCCMDYNVIIHFIIAILLMVALLQIGKYQQHLRNTEAREHYISTDRNLFASAFLHYELEKKHLFTSGILSISDYYHCANNIASVPFIGEVEVLACDSRGCEYWNPDHDITIRIPPNAIPLGVTVQLEVAVALYGPFKFPNNSSPISPILWLCSQKDIVFRKPIEIILPHFVSDIRNSDINFAKADHKWYSIDESGMKCYIFNPVGTTFVNIKEGTQNYGLLSVNHCCYFCLTADSSFSSDLALGAGYCFWCIEKPLSPPQS